MIPNQNMAKRKLSYDEGDWFTIPLKCNGYALGVVARMDKKGGVIAYFFGPKHASMPSLDDSVGNKASDAIFVAKIGDLGLLDGSWRVLGKHPDWIRGEWPLPVFVRTDVVSGEHKKVIYREPDLIREDQLLPCSPEDATKLPQDGSWGSKAVEAKLAKLLSETAHPE